MNHFADARDDHPSILQVRDLTVAYKVRGGEIMAVEDAMLKALAGELAWSLQDGTLALTREGRLLARFAPGEAE